MSWGTRLLDQENFAAQQTEAAKQANPWGHLLDLPGEWVNDTDEGASTAETEGTEGDNPGEPSQMSVASIAQRLAEDPQWWPEALAAEVQRTQPRKTALRAILTVAEDNGGDPETLDKAHAVLDAL